MKKPKSVLKFINLNLVSCKRVYFGRFLIFLLRAPECTFKPQTNNYMGSPLANTTFEQRSKKFEDRLDRIN